MDYQMQIERGIELLALCQRLQSDKDGIDRPDPGVIDKRKTLDSFAMDIAQAITNMTALYKLFPQMRQLEELGRKLERDGKLRVEMGQGYSGAALDYVLTEYGLPKSSS